MRRNNRRSVRRKGLARLMTAAVIAVITTIFVLLINAMTPWFTAFGNILDQFSGPITADVPAAVTETKSGLESAIVSRVIDGDTIVLDNGERVRLIGINAPETGTGSSEYEEGATEATEFVRELVEGKRIWLEPESRDRDRYERLRRYVWLSEPADTDDIGEITAKQLNAILIIEGYAEPMVVNAGESRHEQLFRELTMPME